MHEPIVVLVFVAVVSMPVFHYASNVYRFGCAVIGFALCFPS